MGGLEFYATAAAALPLLMLAIVYESGVTKRLAEVLMEMHERMLLADQVFDRQISEEQALASGLISQSDLKSRLSFGAIEAEEGSSRLDRLGDRLDRMHPESFMGCFVLLPLALIVVGFVTSLVVLFLGGAHPLVSILVWPGLASGVLLLSGLILAAIAEQEDISRQAARYRLRQLGLLIKDRSIEGIYDDLEAKWAVTDEQRRRALAEFLRSRGL